jgi:hypothetical protein
MPSPIATLSPERVLLAAPANNNLWLDDFTDPPVTFRCAPFWSWNERMDPAEVRRQIDLMADAGWGGAFMHSRSGLQTPYLGEEWFDAIEAGIDQSRKRGLKVYLYDEDGWPSGFSGGTVPRANDAFRIKVLCARAAGEVAPLGCSPLGEPVEGLQIYQWLAPLGDTRYRGLCYVDLLSRAAVRQFIDDAYEPYYARFGDDYGDLVVAEFFDEPRVVEHYGHLPAGPAPFSTDLMDRFVQMHGYDPTGLLHLLFKDAPGAVRFRLHYYRTVAELFERNFCQQIADWCAERRIAITGHFMSEESLFSQQLMGCRIMPAYRHMQIPGIDHLGFQVTEILTAKQCQSVVNQYGRSRMMSELYGAGGQNMSFEDRLWIAHHQLCFGVNFFVPHLALYTLVGTRKEDHPPNLYYQQPWWPAERPLQDRLARLCVALSQGTYVAEALILHPGESTVAAWRIEHQYPDGDKLVRKQEQRVLPGAVRSQVDALDKHLKWVMDALLGSQRTFDLGDEKILAEDGAVEVSESGALLRIGRMAYPAVVLPSLLTITPSTFELLKQFLAAGGRVIRCGDAPKLLDGEPSDELQRWLECVPSVDLAGLAEDLRSVRPAAVELESDRAPQVYVHIRDLTDGDRLIFLTNLNREFDFDGKIRIRGSWRSAQLLDPATGDLMPLVIEVDESSIRLVLPIVAAQAHLLLLSQQETKDGNRIAQEALVPVDMPMEAWRVDRLDDNALPLDYAQWRMGSSDWSSQPAPVVAIRQALRSENYSGSLELRYSVQVEDLAAERLLYLVVEYCEDCRILVNGHQVRYDGLPFVYDVRWLPIDITSLLHPGTNTIDVALEFSEGVTPLVDIGPIYLFGDFTVGGRFAGGPAMPTQLGQKGLPDPIIHRLEYGSIVLKDPKPLACGDVTTQGLPFYAGRLRLTHEPPLGQVAARVFQLDSLDAAVGQLEIDGITSGYLMSRPYRLNLQAASQHPGSASLTLYGTLRNLLGPLHHCDGEQTWVSGREFAPVPPLASTEALVKWLDVERDDTWRNDYHLVGFGHIGTARFLTDPSTTDDL